MAAPLTLLLIVAVTIRAVLFRSSLAELIAERVEVVSPITAWKRGGYAAAPAAAPGSTCSPITTSSLSGAADGCQTGVAAKIWRFRKLERSEETKPVTETS